MKKENENALRRLKHESPVLWRYVSRQNLLIERVNELEDRFAEHNDTHGHVAVRLPEPLKDDVVLHRCGRCANLEKDDEGPWYFCPFMNEDGTITRSTPNDLEPCRNPNNVVTTHFKPREKECKS